MTELQLRPWRTFGQLFAQEVRAKGGVLLLGVVIVLLLDAFIAWRVTNPYLQALVALIVALAPVLYWVFGGFAAFWNEFSSGAHLLLRSVPASGITVVAAKYVWLLIELAVLFTLLLGSALYFVNGAIPLSEVQLSSEVALRLGLFSLTALLVPPAIALAASVVGRASRLNLLSAFLAFVLLWWAYALLSGAASGLETLGSFALNFARLPGELCPEGQDCFVRVNGALLLFQPAFAGLLLWIAGRTFDGMDS
ncbi:hypothetical protein [Deinococcus peraridilitoris]|uniref:ABC-type transport system involved in multi-copper enzyme maturation, permease component n=1 Tax=Deinococcus peraridilitoris (strain DSM 19664 / LMG 22246 / CIP 109416 / KR-200) TaxID=937777 RepID=K9ZYS6_DEIPD|nr:hypothetical protein [Deinococcus peraridilitoris]AFZ66803.1 hypothetical protein Deipe_1253 [Deinococcus peraridilitoris DSM 19664]